MSKKVIILLAVILLAVFVFMFVTNLHNSPEYKQKVENEIDLKISDCVAKTGITGDCLISDLKIENVIPTPHGATVKGNIAGCNLTLRSGEIIRVYLYVENIILLVSEDSATPKTAKFTLRSTNQPENEVLFNWIESKEDTADSAVISDFDYLFKSNRLAVVEITVPPNDSFLAEYKQ